MNGNIIPDRPLARACTFCSCASRGVDVNTKLPFRRSLSQCSFQRVYMCIYIYVSRFMSYPITLELLESRVTYFCDFVATYSDMQRGKVRKSRKTRGKYPRCEYYSLKQST